MKKAKGKHPVRALVFLTQPTVFLIAVLILLTYWRVPTRIQLQLVVDQEMLPRDITDLAALLRSIHDQTIVISKATLSYPAYPEIKAVSFMSPIRIELEAQEEFHMEVVTINVERKEVQVRLDGIAQHITLGTPTLLKDRRLTQFHRLKNTRWVVILMITGWAMATIVGWYRVYQELKE